MSTERMDEVERKYDVDASTIFPTLIDVEGVSAMGQPVEVELTAVYFDTADLDLARHGISLRRRTGGDDAGWHLKLPAGPDTRTEFRLPLGRATKTVPGGLLPPVRALIRDRRLTPVARVSTRRLEYALVGADAVILARVCDDEVHAEGLRSPAEAQDWREWEVELVEGPRHLLDAVGQCLLTAGASPASASSKLRRALGATIPPVTVTMPSRKELSRGSTGQLVLAHLAEHTQKLHKQDARLRADLPGSVHKLRIAARRLRSALKTYRPVLAPGSADPVGEELRWLGQVLGEARDAQVMHERLSLLVASEPTELVLGSVSQQIDDDLGAAYRSGRAQALEALDTERYFRLLDALDDLVQSPALTLEAEVPARKLLPHLLGRDAKRLRRAAKAVGRADGAQERDLALHEVRKKAKRLRYAAESAVPACGGRAKTLAASARRVQEALGDHQDSVVARHKLREYGAQTHLSGGNGFTYGRLHRHEQARADEAERRFEAAWADLRRAKLGRKKS